MTQESAGNSRPVVSTQRGVHPGLPRLLRRHQGSAWQKPPQRADRPALDTLARALEAHAGPLVLDSFCGTGQSTAALARRHPEALVIGVDQSAQRLRRHRAKGSYLLLQAHCEAVWRYLAEQGRVLEAHYILYPNPWPKRGHLARRVHGHPAFPFLLSLGGTLELRSNWQIYVEEFGVALHLREIAASVRVLPARGEPLTAFERKYRHSGHTLWQLKAGLTPVQQAP
jgi:tRNA (guanine-N7-)-methyltransferase